MDVAVTRSQLQQLEESERALLRAAAQSAAAAERLRDLEASVQRLHEQVQIMTQKERIPDE